MVAPLSFIDEHFTVWASFPFLKVLLKYLITLILMFFHHALRTVLNFTTVALNRILFQFNISTAMLFWTKLEIWIIDVLSP